MIDAAGMAMGFQSLFAKTKLPALLMVAVGYVCAAIGWILGRKLRVNPFTVSLIANASSNVDASAVCVVYPSIIFVFVLNKSISKSKLDHTHRLGFTYSSVV